MATAAPARASHAVSFLNTIGAKKVNVYVRNGRKPQLTFKLKGKSFGVDIEPDDIETGATIVPQLRDLIRSIDITHQDKGVRAVRDVSTGGSRLKYAREEATLTRAKLGQQAGVAVDFIKWVEVNALPLKPHFTDEQIVALGHVCAVDPHWLTTGQTPGEVVETPVVTALTDPAPVPVGDPTPSPMSSLGVIGERVKAVRKRLGWNQKTLADRLDISTLTVWKIEKGTSTRTVKNQLPQLAAALDVSVLWLRTGVEDEPAAPAVLTVAEPLAQDDDDELTLAPSAAMDYAAIGERIKLARTRIGWSQVELAGKLYYSGATITNTERGRRTGVFAELDKVAKFLKCDVRWLETGDGEAGGKQTIQIVTPSPLPPEPSPAQQFVADPGIVKALEQRINRLEALVRLQYESVVANQALAQRYLKSLHRHVVRLGKTPPAPVKNSKRSVAMKEAWERRRAPSTAIESADVATDVVSDALLEAAK